MDWEPIIWFVIWAVVILASVALVIWAGIAIFAARQFKEVREDFDKGFESDFFKRHR